MATPNLLIHEKSPYLLQHAHNPVGWHPWGERAFERARTEDKPIFLSIGYSTCHWCHVMERESFENEAIAGLLNDHFIPIKVDREERPDVDRIYMVAVQAMGVGGGWPLSMFLTPDLQPFYGGTYFPPVSRYGRAGFPDILKRIHDAWINERSKIHESAQAITAYLREAPQAGAGEPGAGVLKACYDQFLGTYDTVYGGFGDGPKFPRPSVFQFLLRYHRHTGDPHALEMTRHSLRLMASGGMYDHVGGGFHRYSVDGEWRVPHFEKMLYDQAQLVIANLETFQVTRDPLYSAVVQDTIGYVLRDMRVPGGGFCSAEDADSLKPWAPEESGEGAFYLWTQKEIMEMLGQEAGEIFCFAYGVMEEGNAPSDPQQEFVGQNILFIAHGSESTCARFHLTREQLVAVLAEARSKLLARRAGRPRPLRDDKVITAWNGLMISACARAGAALGEPDFITAARFAATFILDTLYDRTKEILLRRFREGEVAIPGQLDDYAFMIQALLDLYEAAGDAGILAHAVRLMKLQLERFEDVQEGGFFDTAEGGTDLLVRTKERYDGAEPSGNSVSAFNLLRLSALIDRPLWRDAASRTIAAAGKLLNTQPSALPLMAAALEFLREPGDQIFIVGDAGDPGTRAFLREIHSRFLPHRVLHMFRPGTEQTQIAQLIPFAGSLKMSESKPTAYLCRDFVCHLPTKDPAELGRALDSARPLFAVLISSARPG